VPDLLYNAHATSPLTYAFLKLHALIAEIRRLCLRYRALTAPLLAFDLCEGLKLIHKRLNIKSGDGDEF
jgi:hypothetical protein